MTAPMLHIHYSKLDRGDMRAVLTKKYDAEDNSPVAQILRRRQESVHKRVVSQNFMWAGGFAMGGLSYWSFRRYNYQARLLAAPFLFYFGTFVGRMVGDVVTGRNGEFERDRFLGSLPGKVYYAPAES
uniref:Transmembrane protein n=1 Tax=Alexandrium catenella TaxID=2925 RepID=A0A7S1MR15_ALECA|mmetsp:Transcript_30559/g.82741  ORF Transcript_30559/g.82741 Transcript_30559/m.82741 type:complete len:128 (+) Transcript_30559:3-386(+)